MLLYTPPTVSKVFLFTLFGAIGLFVWTICGLIILTEGVLRGSVVKDGTRDPEVPGLSLNGSTSFFVGMTVGETLQSPCLVMVNLRKNINNVSCRRDMTIMVLKAV